jgi:teichuronic acid biosynthesis protein TuaE
MSFLRNGKTWVNGLLSLFTLGNVLLSPNLIFLNLYVFVIGLLIINTIDWETKSELLYYFVLLFSVTDFAFNLPLLGRFNIYYLHIALFILTLSMFFSFIRTRPSLNIRRLASNRYMLFLSIFIVYMILSLVWAENRMAGIKYIINYAIMICFMLAVYNFNPNKEKLKNTLKVLLYCLIPVLIIGLLEVAKIRMPIRNVYFDNGWYVKGPEYLQTIPTVFFYNPNNFAVVLVMFMSFILPFIAYSRDKGKNTFFWILQFLALINLIFSTSRTGYIVMLLTMFGFILFFLFTRERKKLGKALAIGLCTIVLFEALSFIPSLGIYYGKFNDTPILSRLGFHSRNINQPLVQYGEVGSSNDRWTMMVNISTGVFKEGHVQGFGVNNTGRYLQKVGTSHGLVNPHSLWFEILGDFGVLILTYLIFIYLSLIWGLLRIYLEARQRAEYGFTSYVAISLIAALGGFILTANAPSSVISFPQMWLLFGLAASIIIRRNEFLRGSSYEPLE